MIKVYEYNKIPIQFDEMDGQIMANATLMCSVVKKRFNDWLILKQTQEYIEAITRKNGISINQLVTTRSGSPENGGGSWIHEKLIVRLSQWINADFALWCDDKLAELIRTGKTEMQNAVTKPMTPAQLLFLNAKISYEHEEKIQAIEQRQSDIEDKLSTIYSIQKTAEESLSIPISNELVAEISTKDQVRQLVNRYSAITYLPQQDIWRRLYNELYYRYHISIRAYKKADYESYLDVAERVGCLHQLYVIISELIKSDKRA